MIAHTLHVSMAECSHEYMSPKGPGGNMLQRQFEVDNCKSIEYVCRERTDLSLGRLPFSELMCVLALKE